MSIPQEAIEAGVKALQSQHGIEKRITPTDDVLWPIVWVALLAAEEVWPHDPPRRDPASTTGGSTTLATPPRTRHMNQLPPQPPRRGAGPCGFGRPQ